MLATCPDLYETLYNCVKQKYPEEFKNNNLLKKPSCYSVKSFSKLPMVLKNNTSNVMIMLKRYPYNLRFVSKDLKENSSVVLVAAKQWDSFLKFVGESPKSNYEVVMAAIMDEAAVIEHASDDLKQDDEFMLKRPEKIQTY